MRWTAVVFSIWIASGLVTGFDTRDDAVIPRQVSSASGLPTLGSESSQSASNTITSASTNSNTASSRATTGTESASRSGESSSSSVRASTSGSSVTSPSSTSIAPTASSSVAANSTADAASANQNALPLQPHITPAFSIGGVILILTGMVYTLIGVKNKWIHTFLSTAYLTSLSITVLIVYVLNPPVSNAIQGAYFVGIFMTGIIFGGGALIFKEITEGLGCLLGGFCLSMWFLTLKEGGLITSTSGKAIFISIFCVLAWSLSFSHYTRAYGLMGSISFSGATAFVLGIDCFSCGGLKEFWIYVWALNDNIFPLNTTTYPITKGTRVESIVIVLVCMIGIISQIKLWKIVKDRQRRRNEFKEDEARRREVVEAAMGRHLERQNDRDRSQWEKQYGDRLNAKRETILWTDAHGEKGYSKIRETEVGGSQNSASSESLEMKTLGPKYPRSMYVTRIKRHSSAPVDSIPEMEETEPTAKAQVRQNVLDKLEGNEGSSQALHGASPAPGPGLSPRLEDDARPDSTGLSAKDVSRNRSPASKARQSAGLASQIEVDEEKSSDYKRYLSAPEEEKKKKRRSFTSMFSRSPKEDDANPSNAPSVSPSQEALVFSEPLPRHSRASSLAATLDFENETLDLAAINTDLANSKRPPEIVISPVGKSAKTESQLKPRSSVAEVPPSPPALSEHFDIDPEELVRPVAEDKTEQSNGNRLSSGIGSLSKTRSDSDTGAEGLSEDQMKSLAATSETERSEILTKGALEQMPSQLSHVALSYRTNEWAKHISAAEAPVFEEPVEMEGEESEAPAHLADPTPTSPPSNRSSLSQVPPPPELTVPVSSTIPSPTEGMRINPVIQPEQQPVSPVVTPEISRTRSSSETRTTRGLRSASTPLLNQPLQATPIDENAPADFVQPQPQPILQTKLRSASALSLNRSTTPTNNAIGVARSGSALNNYPTVQRSGSAANNYTMPQRSGSRQSMVSQSGALPMRSASQSSNYQQMMPQRSETRMSAYDSHQPLRRDTSTEAQRREAILADWRMTQQKTPDQQDQTEMHRQQMLMYRQQKKMMEEQEKAYRQQQELAIDARMRAPDMQQLHREAMRRLQAGANRKITD